MMIFFKLGALLALCFSGAFAQPLASAKAMGIELRYFVQYGFMVNAAQGNYEEMERIEVPAGNSDSLPAGTFYLGGLSPYWGWNLGIGAEIAERHEISFRYEQSLFPYEGNDAARVVDLVQLSVDYRFLFLKKGFVKPYAGVGFDYVMLDYPSSYKLKKGSTWLDGRIAGKGGHAELGAAFFVNRFGILAGPIYRFFSMDRVAIEEEGFDLNPALSHQVFGAEFQMRVYF